MRNWTAALSLRHLLWTLVLIAVLLAATWWQVDVRQLHAWAKKLPGMAVFGLLTALPLLGFPVTALQVVTGMRFDFQTALGLVAASITLQLVISYGVVHAMPGFFEARLASLRQRLPTAAHRPLTIFTLLLPGAPYAMQLYALPMLGVPFRIFLGFSLPIHLARSVIGISLGRFSGDMTPSRLMAFAVYTAALLVIWGWSFRRLRTRLAEGPPPGADDPKRPA